MVYRIRWRAREACSFSHLDLAGVHDEADAVDGDGRLGDICRLHVQEETKEGRFGDVIMERRKERSAKS